MNNTAKTDNSVFHSSHFFVNSDKNQNLMRSHTSNFNNKEKDDFVENNNYNNNLLILQKKCGNQAVQRLIKAGRLQTKLKISHQSDPYEQEADRVAEQVVANNSSFLLSRLNRENYGVNDVEINRKCSACSMKQQNEDEEKDLKISRKSIDKIGNTELSPNRLSLINSVLSDTGKPLNPSIRQFMEPRFGYDFGNVRIHANDYATSRSAKSLNALAYTIGKDIFFGDKEYQPSSLEGKRLLAHELVHTIQQSNGEAVQRTIGDGHDLQSLWFSGDPILEACYDGQYRMMRGETGQTVRKIQTALIFLGFDLGKKKDDGIFGQFTGQAVSKFKRSHHIEPSDPVVGPRTMKELDDIFKDIPRPSSLSPTTEKITFAVKSFTAEGKDVQEIFDEDEKEVSINEAKFSSNATVEAIGDLNEWEIGYLQTVNFESRQSEYEKRGKKGSIRMLMFLTSPPRRDAVTPVPPEPWYWPDRAIPTNFSLSNVEMFDSPNIRHLSWFNREHSRLVRYDVDHRFTTWLIARNSTNKEIIYLKNARWGVSFTLMVDVTRPLGERFTKSSNSLGVFVGPIGDGKGPDDPKIDGNVANDSQDIKIIDVKS